MKIYSLKLNIFKIIKFFLIIIFFGLNSSLTVSKSYTYDYEHGAIESIRKSICLNTFLSSACSSESAEILGCSRDYSGEQAQRICQYELGLKRRRSEWELAEDKKRAATEAQLQNQRRIVQERAETKRLEGESQAREIRAQDCIKSELKLVSGRLKKLRDFTKLKVGAELTVLDNSFEMDIHYTAHITTAISLPDELRPILNKTAMVFNVDTACDSTTRYVAYVVTTDGQKIDGFIAYRVLPRMSDLLDERLEIIELRWLGPRIQAGINRLNASKEEEYRQLLERLRVQAEIVKAKELERARLTFLGWSFASLIIFFALVIYIYKWYKKRNRLYNLSDGSSGSSTNFKYNYLPVTKDQINMQNGFRAKYPFVQHNVRYEHMKSFIEACNQHSLEKGSFPNGTDQHEILLKIR